MPIHRASCLLLLLAALPAVDPPVLSEARRIADHVQRTWYTHRLEVDESAGVYGLDCSGYVARVLSATAPAALAAIPLEVGTRRALAADFHAAFAAAPSGTGTGWRRIARLADARAGDIAAWSRPDRKPGETTGHVVILDADPVAEAAGRWRLRVLDATSAPHGDDRRDRGTGGVGRGTLWLDAGPDGAPAGLHWSRPDREAVAVPIAIARWGG